jgi:glycosyltransferase involved in cell wall biosynthesis
VNTRRFSDHPRIIHCGFLDRREIWDFYAACDVLLNGRIMGESFGFSIVEPLSIGKSVIAPDLARNFRMDQHHISLLKPFNLLYRNASHLSWLIDRELQSQTVSSALTHAVESFGQRRVMQKFKDFYING